MKINYSNTDRRPWTTTNEVNKSKEDGENSLSDNPKHSINGKVHDKFQ